MDSTSLQPFLINLVSDLLWLILGAIAMLLLRCLRVTRPTRLIWEFLHPEKIIICVAIKKINTKDYKKPVTGIGQLKAIAYIVTSLNKAYKEIDFKNILSSEEELGRDIDSDIILLGGPKTNKIAGRFFEIFKGYNIASQDKNGNIFWKENSKPEKYEGKITDGKVTKDYGLIIKMHNILSTSKKTKLILFAGCHTYGTIAAAQYFCEYLPKEIRKEENYALLISCDILNGYPTNLTLEKKYFFKIKGQK